MFFDILYYYFKGGPLDICGEVTDVDAILFVGAVKHIITILFLDEGAFFLFPFRQIITTITFTHFHPQI